MSKQPVTVKAAKISGGCVVVAAVITGGCVVVAAAITAMSPRVRDWAAQSWGPQTPSAISGPVSQVSHSLLPNSVLFNPDDPFPIEPRIPKPGTRLSLVRQLLPSGTIEVASYHVEFEEGPFARAFFCYTKNELDPEVEWVMLRARDHESFKYIIEQAYSAFGNRAVSKVLGTVIEVNGIGGFDVSIGNDMYTIKKSQAPDTTAPVITLNP